MAVNRTIGSTARSRELYEDAQQLLVDGIASALHKGPSEDYPTYMESGKGSRVFDVDGNEYLDYMGGYGPLILGHCPPSVTEAVIEQVRKGSQFAAPFRLLNEVTAKLLALIPCAERLAYQSTGTEANMLAFRLARAYTGKDKIIRFEGHYHGWSDEELVSAAPDSVKMMGPRNRPWRTLGSAGQREAAAADIIVLPWNDLDLVARTVKRHRHEIAALITEPIMCNCEVIWPKPGFLQGLRQITADNEIVLIFDEVITAFRVALGGAQEYYGVKPDLCTFAKAVAGGYPLAGVAGQREILAADVHPVGTFNANPIVIAACRGTIKELEKPGVYDHLARVTDRLVQGIREIAAAKGVRLYCEGAASIWEMAFGITEPMNEYRDNFKVDKATYQRFRKLCLERGLRLHPTRGRQYVSAADTDQDVDETLSVIEEVMGRVTTP